MNAAKAHRSARTRGAAAAVEGGPKTAVPSWGEHRSLGKLGFTLAELMIAVLFVSIALFAYIALHTRLIVSSSKIETRQVHREAAESTLIGDMANSTQPPTGSPSPTIPGKPAGLVKVKAVQTWEDVNGQQTFLVDTYMRPENPGW